MKIKERYTSSSRTSIQVVLEMLTWRTLSAEKSGFKEKKASVNWVYESDKVRVSTDAII